VIIGIGNDLIDIRRIERTLERFGARFTERCFTDMERERADRRRLRAATYAKRFAAKEACAKALGTGFAQGVYHKDLGVVNLSGGKPTMELTGGAKQRLEDLLPQGTEPKIDITITDEPPLAQVFVIISAVPKAA
jgi:holo-[acyl-carrier protein] synthase